MRRGGRAVRQKFLEQRIVSMTREMHVGEPRNTEIPYSVVVK